MNFSSFVAPFSVTSAINNHQHQFAAAKFAGAADEAHCAQAADAGPEDGGAFLRVNAESMMAAVSRYQNCGGGHSAATAAPRFNQHHNLLHPPPPKYYRAEIDAAESIATNSVGSSFTTTAANSAAPGAPSAAKFRLNAAAGLPPAAYGNGPRSGHGPPLPHAAVACNGKGVEHPGKRCAGSDPPRGPPPAAAAASHAKKEEKADLLMAQQSPSAVTNLSVASWQSIAAVAAAVAGGAPAPSATPATAAVADYLSQLPGPSLPISLHNLFKYSAAEKCKEEGAAEQLAAGSPAAAAHGVVGQPLDAGDGYFNAAAGRPPPAAKKKKRKKPPKEKKEKPRPGEIRTTTALDGSALFCCPECHMAYPDKGLLEQHMLGHTIERRFFCDICGAGLKRKDHLTRHKQSHNPDRPHACSVCTKAFKRKEQLALHYVIHSGEKRHVCPECGKGFYRKDHLRKHTRSHIARRVKAELSQYVPAAGAASCGGGNGAVNSGAYHSAAS